MRRWCKLTAALTLVTAGGVHAQLDAESSLKLVAMSAGMNEMAAACGHITPAELQKTQVNQREATLQGGITAAQYEASYTKAKEDFLKRWGTLSKAQQSEKCNQVKALSEQAAKQAKQLEQFKK